MRDGRAQRVADHEQRDVEQHEPERPEARGGVEAGDPGPPETPLEDGHPRHEQHLVEHQVGSDEAREWAERAQSIRRRPEHRLRCAPAEPNGEDDEWRAPHDRGSGDVTELAPLPTGVSAANERYAGVKGVRDRDSCCCHRHSISGRV